MLFPPPPAFFLFGLELLLLPPPLLGGARPPCLRSPKATGNGTTCRAVGRGASSMEGCLRGDFAIIDKAKLFENKLFPGCVEVREWRGIGDVAGGAGEAGVEAVQEAEHQLGW